MSRYRGRASGMTWLLISLIALAILGGLAFYRPFASEAGAGDLPATAGGPTPPPLPVRRETFLVMGVDRRANDAGRADSMMLVSYNPKNSSIAMLSLPRDTWAQIPGHGYDKVNHAFAYGGEGLSVQTVQALLGIPIDHYITLTFEGFQRVVNELGGVEIEVEKHLYYEDPTDFSLGPEGLIIDIPPGLQRMDGLTALKFSRYRSDEEGDFGRIRRQQQVTRELMSVAARPANVTRLPQLIPLVATTLATDMTIADMLRLATGAKEALASPPRTGLLRGEGRAVAGIYYTVPDLAEQRIAAYELLVGEAPPESFIRRAKEDQAAYSRALTEAIAEAERLAAEEEARKAAELAAAEAAQRAAAAAKAAQAAKPPAQTAAKTPAKTPAKTETKAPPKPPPITVAVVDGSGKNLGPTYVLKLREAGFRVARIQKAGRVVARTQIIDHAGQPGTADRLRVLFPTATFSSKPDKTAPEAVEIILGGDLP